MKKQKDLKLKITVEAEFGSEFQMQTHSESLRIMILAWAEFMRNAHKGNKFIINGQEVL